MNQREDGTKNETKRHFFCAENAANQSFLFRVCAIDKAKIESKSLVESKNKRRENQRPIVVIATLPPLPSLVPSLVPSCVYTYVHIERRDTHTSICGTHERRPARLLAVCLRGSRTRARARARTRRHLDSPYPLRTRQLEPRGSARCTRPYVKDEVVLDPGTTAFKAALGRLENEIFNVTRREWELAEIEDADFSPVIPK
ncbi:hypothetical protein ALC53_11063 [Atta colombica]|uniref:Uncharacterized protein n=1 Tax=Atta colombica TaxID=520822 RepID=A0A195B1N8_9HYME|nr:hypothetical protein ALC53_11063 [Atta colombica]